MNQPHAPGLEPMLDGPAPDVLRIENLSIAFPPVEGRPVTVVDDVSLSVPRGSVVALVGESGCGKSLTALSILRLLPSPPAQMTSGRILFRDEALRVPHPSLRASDGARPNYSNDSASGTCVSRVQSPTPRGGAPGLDLLTLDPKSLRHIRGNRIAMIFQEPMTSLNPVLPVGEQISEAILLHSEVSPKAARERAVELLEEVEISDPRRRTREYPHQLSGGMRQRVMIAMAIACKPALLIADEPTTALDVTTQRQILDLLASLRAEYGMSVLLITHDLSVVAQRADYVYVMYAGRIVEHAAANELLAHPLHPYTQGLLECTPRLGRKDGRLPTIPGQVPEPSRFTSGCRFHPRCPVAAQLAGDNRRAGVQLPGGQRVLRRCVESYEGEESGTPRLRQLSRNHYVACWEAAE